MNDKLIITKTTQTEKVYQDKNKKSWNYLTEKELLAKYPDVNFKILGDFCDKLTQTQVKYSKLTDESQSKEAYVIPYLGNAPKDKYIIGFIPTQDEDAYVRILGNKRGKVIGTLAALCLLLCIFLGGLWLGNSQRPVDTPVKIKSGQMYNPNPAAIRLPGIEKMVVKHGSTRVNTPLLNVEGNAYNLVYVISLTDTGEVLYKSQSIKPGYGVKRFDLKKKLKKGSYPIEITVTSSAGQKNDKKHKKDQGIAYNVGKLNATLVVK